MNFDFQPSGGVGRRVVIFGVANIDKVCKNHSVAMEREMKNREFKRFKIGKIVNKSEKVDNW